MAANRYTWIKLFCEVIDDPKMARLNDKLWRKVIELFLLAGRNGLDGRLQPLDELAWSLRVKKGEMEKILRSLESCEVVNQLENGCWNVTHFASRQAAFTAAERQAKHRNSGRQASHENVTDIDIEVEIEKEEDILYRDGTPPESLAGGPEQTDPRIELIKEALNKFGFRLNENSGGMIAGWLNEFPGPEAEDIIRRAVEHAANHHADSLAYVDKILIGWLANGVPGPRQKQISRAKRKGPDKKSDFLEALERTMLEHPEL